jgi:hypothetical protein
MPYINYNQAHGAKPDIDKFSQLWNTISESETHETVLTQLVPKNNQVMAKMQDIQHYLPGL